MTPREKLEAIRELHVKTCEINGDNSPCNIEGCEMTMCGPCGDAWPCETIRIIEDS